MYNLGEDITQCININRSMSIIYELYNGTDMCKY